MLLATLGGGVCDGRRHDVVDAAPDGAADAVAGAVKPLAAVAAVHGRHTGA
jgi:hypothetical protein